MPAGCSRTSSPPGNRDAGATLHFRPGRACRLRPPTRLAPVARSRHGSAVSLDPGCLRTVLNNPPGRRVVTNHVNGPGGRVVGWRDVVAQIGNRFRRVGVLKHGMDGFE
ncbi:MAG: hypothetical protein MZV64_10445 [Ignavibacteriales bacterium]|nr:hypothetical protein [Ignavibacteriales bacterium]